MSLDRLKWAIIVLAISLLAFTQAITMFILEPALGSWAGVLVFLGLLPIGVVGFSMVVFRILGGMQQRIVRQNEELSALNAVASATSGSLELEEAAHKALGNVMEVTRASAAEIVIHPEEPTSRETRLSQGAANELRKLDGLWGADSVGASTTRPEDGMQIVDLRAIQNAAAVEACARGLCIMAWVPLQAQNRNLGVMKLLARETSHLTSEGSERLLAAMGNQIAVAVQGSLFFQDVLRRGKEAQSLYEIGLEIASLQDIEKILRSVVDQAREMLGGDAAGLCLALGNGRGLRLAGSSAPEGVFEQTPIRLTPFPSKLGTRRSPDPEGELGCSALAKGTFASHLAAPLVVGTSTIGELCVLSAEEEKFGERDRELLASLADMAAIAMNNARLLEGERYLAVLEERERLSREMHDSLAQVLGYLHLKAQAASLTLAREDVAKTALELEEMATLAHESFLDVREAILGLRQSLSPAAGIVGTLREYLEKFSRQSGIDVNLEVDESRAPELSPEVEVQLVRVVQEALTNVRKHANADTTWIRIADKNGGTSVCVEDNGQGFDPAVISGRGGRRLGVRIMKERIEQVGGRFEIESSPGSGTKVRIRFPATERR